MTKAEAKQRQAELKSKIETYLDDIKHLNDEMSELEAIINKKDDWRDKLVQPDTTGFYFIERDEDQGFVVEEEYFSERKPEHAFNRVSQAELIMNKILLMQEMHAFAHVKNEGWLPDWADLNEEKFGISYSTYVGFEVDSSMGCNYFIFGISVELRKTAEEMLEEFGERIEEIYNKQY